MQVLRLHALAGVLPDARVRVRVRPLGQKGQADGRVAEGEGEREREGLLQYSWEALQFPSS